MFGITLRELLFSIAQVFANLVLKVVRRKGKTDA